MYHFFFYISADVLKWFSNWIPPLFIVLVLALNQAHETNPAQSCLLGTPNDSIFINKPFNNIMNHF